MINLDALVEVREQKGKLWAVETSAGTTRDFTLTVSEKYMKTNGGHRSAFVTFEQEGKIYGPYGLFPGQLDLDEVSIDAEGQIISGEVPTEIELVNCVALRDEDEFEKPIKKGDKSVRVKVSDSDMLD